MSNYIPQFPTPTTPIPQFQQIINNWKALNDVYALDHTTFDETDSTIRGHHRFVRFYAPQALDPTLVNPQAQLYIKTQGTTRQLFFAEKPDVAALIIRQLTDLPVTLGFNPGTAGGTLSIIDTPWNMRIYYGLTNPFTGPNKTVVFPTPFTSVFMVAATANDSVGTSTSCAVFVGNLGLGNTANISVNWFIVGRL